MPAGRSNQAACSSLRGESCRFVVWERTARSVREETKGTQASLGAKSPRRRLPSCAALPLSSPQTQRAQPLLCYLLKRYRASKT